MNKTELRKIRKERARKATEEISQEKSMIEDARKRASEAERVLKEAGAEILEREERIEKAQIIKDGAENPSIEVSDGLAGIICKLPYAIRRRDNKYCALHRHETKRPVSSRYVNPDPVIAYIMEKCLAAEGVTYIQIPEEYPNLIIISIGYRFKFAGVREGIEKILTETGFSISHGKIYPDGGGRIGEEMGEHVSAIAIRDSTDFHTNYEIIKNEECHFNNDDDLDEFILSSITARILKKIWAIPALQSCTISSYKLEFDKSDNGVLDDGTIIIIAAILEEEIKKEKSKKAKVKR